MKFKPSSCDTGNGHGVDKKSNDCSWSEEKRQHPPPSLPEVMEGGLLKLKGSLVVAETRETVNGPVAILYRTKPTAASSRQSATFETTPVQEKSFISNTNAVLLGTPVEDNSSFVVDLGSSKVGQAPLGNAGHVPSSEQGLLGQGNNLGIFKLRRKVAVNHDPTDVHSAALAETSQQGFVKNGNIKDVLQMYKEQSPLMKKGVICNTEVLHGVNGHYEEQKQYTVNPARFKGGYGVCDMVQDNTTGKIVMRKTVEGEWKNEVLVPLSLGRTPGIPEVYGIVQEGTTVQIFQKFAGDTLEKLRQPESGYAERVRDVNMVLGLAFQGFRTLGRVHSKGIQHLDIKPENLCVDMSERPPSLHLIDFGSCQLPGEVTMQGFTFEYLSPEAALTLIKNEARREHVAMDSGTDVWAMALSLMFLLKGHHPMVQLCTGNTMYQAATRQDKERQRVETLMKIAKLKDEEVSTLIEPAWPEVLKHLFANTLRVDKEKRWSAEKAADFLLSQIAPHSSSMAGQPSSPQSSNATEHQPPRSSADSPVVQLAPSSGLQERHPTVVQKTPSGGLQGRQTTMVQLAPSSSMQGRQTTMMRLTPSSGLQGRQSTVMQLAPSSSLQGRQPTVMQLAPSSGGFVQPAPPSTCAAISSVIRLRVGRARPAHPNPQPSHVQQAPAAPDSLSPWSVSASPSPGNHQHHQHATTSTTMNVPASAPHVMMFRVHPGKRKLPSEEEAAQLQFKMIRQ